MSAKRLFPHLHALQLDDILLTESLVVLSLSSPRRSARCPLCQRRSKSVHSRYTRTAADLPASGRRSRLHHTPHCSVLGPTAVP